MLMLYPSALVLNRRNFIGPMSNMCSFLIRSQIFYNYDDRFHSKRNSVLCFSPQLKTYPLLKVLRRRSSRLMSLPRVILLTERLILLKNIFSLDAQIFYKLLPDPSLKQLNNLLSVQLCDSFCKNIHSF